MGEKAPQKDSGLVSFIQRFSVHDGPGIRTTVFMKGCPLVCRWCHNPESLKPYPELMVRDNKCQTCGKCVESCSIGAIIIDKKIGRKIDRSKCNNCFECVKACPTRSLTRLGEEMSVENVMTEIEKDEIFYVRSNGGVTVSGGEPLCQGAFVTRLLRACKQGGFHTALDTCGYASWDTFERVLHYVDIVLYDIKHMNSGLHKEMTGHDNRLILSNLDKISHRKRIWLRIPLVAGFNDTEDHLKMVGKLGDEKGVERISILPFHEFGAGKYQQLGKEYPASELKTPSSDQIQKAKSILEAFGLNVVIGE